MGDDAASGARPSRRPRLEDQQENASQGLREGLFSRTTSPRFHRQIRNRTIRIPSIAENSNSSSSSGNPSHDPSSSSSSLAASNTSARAKALDLQHTSPETEGAEGVASSLHAATSLHPPMDREEEELQKAKELAHGAEEEGDGGPDLVEESATSTAYLVSYFIAGGAAGAASRTVVSPLERLKSESAAKQMRHRCSQG